MKRLAFVFTQPPHTTSVGREGLDALLALSSFSKDIQVFFISDSILQLIPDQKPTIILCHNYIVTFPVMSLYDIKEIYICSESINEKGLQGFKEWIIKVKVITAMQIRYKLEQRDVVLTF